MQGNYAAQPVTAWKQEMLFPWSTAGSTQAHNDLPTVVTSNRAGREFSRYHSRIANHPKAAAHVHFSAPGMCGKNRERSHAMTCITIRHLPRASQCSGAVLCRAAPPIKVPITQSPTSLRPAYELPRVASPSLSMTRREFVAVAHPAAAGWGTRNDMRRLC